MEDIAALKLLDTALGRLTDLQISVKIANDVDTIKEDAMKTCEEYAGVLTDIGEYIDRIQERLTGVNIQLRGTIEAIVGLVKQLFDSLVTVDDPKNLVKANIKALNDALELQRQAKRLAELCTETEKTLQKLHSLNISRDEVDNLKGCLASWENAAAVSFKKQQENERREELEEQKRRKEEERIRKKEEEAEKKRKKLEEARIKEERERKEREEHELKLREERLRKEEEERENRRREEEENERKRQAEEDDKRRKRDEAINERKKREAEEEEERRQEAEQRRKALDRIRKKEEARKIRLDPENWTPITFTRTDNSEETEDNNAYHKGISCIITAPDGSFEDEQFISTSSDDIDDILEKLSPGDKVASSIVSLTSTSGAVNAEAPVRLHVPHVQLSDTGDELVIMYSVNNCDQWNKTYPATATKKSISSNNVKLACLELDSFETVQLVALARQKGEVIVVDTPGTNHQLAQEKKTKLVVARDTFKEPTELFITVRPVTLESTSSIVKEDSDSFKEILSTSPLLTIECQRPPSKSMELTRSVNNNATQQRGKLFRLYRTKDGQWNMAPSEVQEGQTDVTVTLPASRGLYSYLELEMPTQTSPETVYKAAETVFGLATKTSVCVLIRQRSAEPTDAILQIVCREALNRRIQELDGLGYDHGGSRSSAFSLKDGDRLRAHISGNVGFSDDMPDPMVLAFTVLIQKAAIELKFVVNNTFVQKDFPHYVGLLTCELQTRLFRPNADDGLKIELPVQIPKGIAERSKTQLIHVPVRFPYYLTALTAFLAKRLTAKTDVEWMDVMKMLDTDKKIKQLERRARNKCDAGEETNVCRTVLLDWMKEQPRHVDKVPQLLAALNECHLNDLKMESTTFVNYYKTSLTDAILRNISKGLGGSVEEIGEVLGFDPKKVVEIIKPFNGGEGDPIFQLLAEWRETEQAVELGLNALKKLESTLMRFKR